MKIGKYHLKHNERIPYYVDAYLGDRIDSLVDYLEKKFGDEYEVYYGESIQSEARYVSLENNATGKSHTWSFRNHDNFASSSYDTAIRLSEYETWSECKKHFLNVLVPKELTEMEKEEVKESKGEWLARRMEDEEFVAFMNKHPPLKNMTRGELIAVDLQMQKIIEDEFLARNGYCDDEETLKKKSEFLESAPKEFALLYIYNNSHYGAVEGNMDKVISNVLRAKKNIQNENNIAR